MPSRDGHDVVVDDNSKAPNLLGIEKESHRHGAWNLDKSNGKEIDLYYILDTLLKGRWIVLVFLIISMLIGFVASVSVNPIYKSTAVIHIDEPKSLGIGSVEDLFSDAGNNQNISSSLEVLKTRMVLRPVVKELNLQVTIQPYYFPVIGQMFANYHRTSEYRDSLAPAFMGMNTFAWGGENVEIAYVSVPKELEKKQLKLVVLGNDGYALYHENDVLLKGTIGVLLVHSSESYDKPFKIRIDKINARENVEFYLNFKSELDAIVDLSESFSAHERGLKSSIINVEYQGADPTVAKSVVDSISKSFYYQDKSRATEEAKQSLEFLNQQLPKIKNKLLDVEKNYNSYRSRTGTVDLNIESSNLLQKILETETLILELVQKRDDVALRFKKSHPIYENVNNKINRLEGKRKELVSQVNKLPQSQQEILRLSREVEVNTELYTRMLTTSQELQVAQAGELSKVRILDYGEVLLLPISPNRMLVVSAVVLLGLLVGIVVTLILKSSNVIYDPDEIETLLKLPVLASIMHSSEHLSNEKKKRHHLPVFTAECPDSLTTECFRSLDTMLRFLLLSSKNNVISISGPCPGVGKSFVAINLANVLASSGKRVVVIDADMRRGKLKKYLKIPTHHGLSETVMSKKVKVYNVSDTLYLVPAGARKRNVVKLLTHKNFECLIDGLSKKFDYVVIDTPPVLAVTDPVIITKYSGINLLVVKYMSHSASELQQTISTLNKGGVKVSGVVMNNVVNSGFIGSKLSPNIYKYSYESVDIE